jgi:hypothetical protein
MLRTFVGLPFFEREWQRLDLKDEDRRALLCFVDGRYQKGRKGKPDHR